MAIKLKDSPENKDCALIIDAMSIRKQTVYDPKVDTYAGFSDYGGALQEPCEQLASEALVFLLVRLRGHWKCPIPYFLTDKLSSNVQTQLVKIALLKTNKIGLRVWSVTCEGASTNLDMFKKLGCKFGKDFNSTASKFKHPSTQQDGFAILDPCHMLKLARNSLGDLSSFFSPSGQKIEWKFIKQLYELQKVEGLKLGNKLSSSHTEYGKTKMNVSLAAQTLSSSVADAIEFLSKGMKLPNFAGSEATVEFIRMIDCLFDILNSRNPLAKGFKQPLCSATAQRWMYVLKSTAGYLMSLKSSSGQPLYMHRR